MEKRYVSLSVVTGMVVGNVSVPLEVAVVVCDSQMKPLDDYGTPVVPSDRYDLSMVSMHTPAYLTNALEAEGLWNVMEVSAAPVESADRYIMDKIDRLCDPDQHQVIVLCDHLAPTIEATSKFLPSTKKRLDKHNAQWVEIEPLKRFVEVEQVYGETQWKFRATPRAKAVAFYAQQMERTMRLGSQQIIAAG